MTMTRTRSERAVQTTAKHIKRNAEELADEALTDACRRTVISRAYYAAYHRCTRWEGLLPHRSKHHPRGGVHAQLIGRLKDPNPACGLALMQRSEALGELLEEQFKRRVKADYELQIQTDQSTMDQQLEDVRHLFAECADPGP
ncbi:hypothetical protein CDL60_28825 [Roseateles noduli]|nr:hypothetical protein CDL60_28825 [Roseateles noduli]